MKKLFCLLLVLAMVFYLFDGKRWWQRLIVAAGCLITVFYNQLTTFAMTLVLERTLALPTLSRWDLWQLFSLAALPLIFLYNGKKGNTPASPLGKWALQWSFYLFYPVQMMILYLIA